VKTTDRFQDMTRELMRDIDDYLAELDEQRAQEGTTS